MEFDYDELFGVDTSGKKQEGAEPAGDSSEGEKERDVAVPADDGNGSVDTDGVEGGADGAEEDDAGADDTDDTGDEPKKELSKEERAANAAARRKAETQAAIDAAVAAAREEERANADKRLKEFFAGAGLVNPLDGNKPISNLEEFKAYRQAYEAQQLERQLKAGQLTPEILEKVVASNPVIRKAEEIVSQAEEEKQAAQRTQADVRVAAELEEIRKLDPTVNSLEDLLKMENGKVFYDKVKQGYSLIDAYRLVNFEKLAAQRAAAASQQTLNKANSKNHLTPSVTRGAGAVTVPADELALYRELNPGMSEAEIQAHYNKYKKPQ